MNNGTVPSWIHGTAEYMAKARPDIYTYEKAHAELVEGIETLRNHDRGLDMQMTGSFILIRIIEDDGVEEFQVAQFVSSVATFQPEEDCLVIGNTRLGVDLPPPNGWEDDAENFWHDGLTDY